ncbi:YciI family protein [Micromonospora harpali]|uniref:DGPFAETKE family protein n=2 Tax=Micromonospora TaxID=1873 RepID=A0A0D0X5Q9_9ACTN|nr:MULTISPECIES: YciI family protein [Micromonospora]KIR66461.1 DGPFAETKE family protein [Micromonospora haikouensis]
MGQYLISIYHPADTGRPDPEFLAGVMREVEAIHHELVEAGSWVFGQGLHAPETATVLRADGDGMLVTDGPFAEGKEYLGGITIVSVPDLDVALDWGRRYARATTLPVEVRPFAGGS